MPLQPPPIDEDGAVVPHNHSGIADEHRVIRRISTHQIVTDKYGVRRLSSLAFKASSGANGGMSVDLEQLIIEAGLVPMDYVTTPRWFGSLVYEVRELRAMNLQVGFEPLEDNPYHGEVWGIFDRPTQRHLCETAVWFVEIEGVAIAA